MRGWSFHSVKGGVGKSTLAAHAALALARRFPERPVWLVDLDLTGTSLSDGLALCAPRWTRADARAADPRTALRLDRPPQGFWNVADSRAQVENRAENREDPPKDGRLTPRGVPFLNDWLLHATAHWDGKELPLRSIAWRWENAPENLHVLPSSALPDDLRYAIPVVFDEEYTAFFEARLEQLFAVIAENDPEAEVVVDVPPTIPGLSRAVLGLALRLDRPLGERVALALDDIIPSPLDQAPFSWRAALVATLDRPDFRAARRWLQRVLPDEERVIRLVLNRTPQLDSSEQRDRLAWITRDPASRDPASRDPASRETTSPAAPLAPDVSPAAPPAFSGFDADASVDVPLLGNAVWIANDPALSLFDWKDEVPPPHPAIETLLDRLGQDA